MHMHFSIFFRKDKNKRDIVCIIRAYVHEYLDAESHVWN